VQDEGNEGCVSDGLGPDDAGRLYVTDGEHDAIHRRLPDGAWETIISDPRLLRLDTMSLADGFLYVTANQLYRQDEYRGGQDQRRKPYVLFRMPIDAGRTACPERAGSWAGRHHYAPVDGGSRAPCGSTPGPTSSGFSPSGPAPT
jgi:hypothetical protein